MQEFRGDIQNWPGHRAAGVRHESGAEDTQTWYVGTLHFFAFFQFLRIRYSILPQAGIDIYPCTCMFVHL